MNIRFHFNKNPAVSLPWCVHRDDTDETLYTKHVRVLAHGCSHRNTNPTCQSDWVYLVMDALILSNNSEEIVIGSNV